ncbi:2-oxoglutarate and iron-dependent oxygenase domain-containing protein 2 isoform X1 [Hydra vulgaris]|uniref:2-oxoglutarate and iron-dependent oxygenase domain-containing protein 2 isoform X1 n=1 Tax=Hydra vulgaris TaxID=6087 RepID=UPI001F5ECEDC|nr:2-oxoglutarate and iron-dependent oxygenase domain-containing protein 2 isoform X1 [Hydra vulgaris]
MTGNSELICKCFLTNNIFVKSCGIHFTFRGDKEFINDYKEFFSENNYSNFEISEVIKEIHAEIERRKENGKLSLLRKKIINENYIPLHREIYVLKDDYLHREFLCLVQESCHPLTSRKTLINKLLKTEEPEVFRLRVFNKEFCHKMVEEIEHFNSTNFPKGRPNTMNTLGILLGEIGFNESFLNEFRTRFLNPIFSILYPNCVGKSGFDSHRAFVVVYDCENQEVDDTGLSLHYDNSEVTINICLNDNFEDGELFFSGLCNTQSLKYTRVEHKFGFGVLHQGHHLHGAMPISSGKRYNLIMWLRSSDVRNLRCPMCDSTPSLIETEGDGDGFTSSNQIVNVCKII